MTTHPHQNWENGWWKAVIKESTLPGQTANAACKKSQRNLNGINDLWTAITVTDKRTVDS